MEAAIEDFLYKPACDDSSANGRHFLLASLQRIRADVLYYPIGQRLPVFADVEGQIVDCAIEPVETSGVFVVIQCSARLRYSLVSHGVLELFDLAIERFNLGLAIKI